MPVVRRRYDDGLHILVLKNPAQVCCTFSSSRFLEVRKPFLVRITDPGDFSDLLEFVAMVVCPSTAADQGYLELRSRCVGSGAGSERLGCKRQGSRGTRKKRSSRDAIHGMTFRTKDVETRTAFMIAKTGSLWGKVLPQLFGTVHGAFSGAFHGALMKILLPVTRELRFPLSISHRERFSGFQSTALLDFIRSSNKLNRE